MADELPQEDPGQAIDLVIVTLTTGGADFTWNPDLRLYLEPEDVPAVVRKVGEHLARLAEGFEVSANELEEAMRP